MRKGSHILHHCNTGALATVDIGMADTDGVRVGIGAVVCPQSLWCVCMCACVHAVFVNDTRAAACTYCMSCALARSHLRTRMLASGTALGVVYEAHKAGKDIHVWVDESRCVRQ